MTANLQIAAGIETMKNPHLEKNLKLSLVKYFLFYSLSLLMIQDASSATDMKCEIKSSCCVLTGCQHTDPTTVNPDSNITLNCSVITGGLELGTTWRQAKQKIQNSTDTADLVLLQSNSTKDSDNMSCHCTNITFTRAVKIVWFSDTPSFITEGSKPKDLECFFSGWPFPLEVQWYKDGKIITNGTEGIYHSEDKKWKYGEETLRSTLHLPPGRVEQEGLYNCSAKNSIPGWKSEDSEIIQMIYKCPSPKGPTIDSDPEVLAKTFSTVNLTCLSGTRGNCPTELIWHNDTAPLESGKKYQIVQKEMVSICKLQSILSIFNVTEHDEGTYSCKWNCKGRVAAIQLKVFVQSRTAPATESVTTGPSSNLGSGGRREWLLPIIIISAGSVTVLFMFFVQFCVKKRWKSSYNIPSDHLSKEDLINRMFISYSSKDFGWVTENIISILEKHSIDYSIHSRDFEIGRPIVENMANSVYGSRQVLIVLSENYLASNFCREELHMAVQRGLDGGDSSLILVKINNLKKKQLPAALRNKSLVNFDKYKTKQDWEEKIICEILKSKNASV